MYSFYKSNKSITGILNVKVKVKVSTIYGCQIEFQSQPSYIIKGNDPAIYVHYPALQVPILPGTTDPYTTWYMVHGPYPVLQVPVQHDVKKIKLFRIVVAFQFLPKFPKHSI